ncbi:hypothetical protein D4764_06G0008000 [Takifugu flavidus]|uniref:Uncharacterized protein n=1 Tax=Takifugu flavidus TaxID=433684 RepID=A0A5C6N0S4_9TELE|nr:hypothetical protein D4764_06G0008000 [Takifugu flavidus]
MSVKSASIIYSAVVIFLDDVSKVERLVESGVVLRDTFTPVYPLVNPVKKITVSNAPLFIKNDDLCKALSSARGENAGSLGSELPAAGGGAAGLEPLTTYFDEKEDAIFCYVEDTCLAGEIQMDQVPLTPTIIVCSK